MQALLFSPHVDETAVLTAVLQQAGLTVRSARDFSRAVENWPQQPADLILAVLPDSEVHSLKGIRQMRSQTAVPFLAIVNALTEDQQVNLMEAGLDLVICRPYGVRLLLVQVRSLLRRTTGLPFHSLPKLSQAGVTLDPSARTVQVADGLPKRLTQLEFRLMYTFITHPGHILSPERLVENVWGYEGEGNRELVRGLVQRLRSKIEPNPSKPTIILTEGGVGYHFNRNAALKGD